MVYEVVYGKQSNMENVFCVIEERYYAHKQTFQFGKTSYNKDFVKRIAKMFQGYSFEYRLNHYAMVIMDF